jgi:hypothetical protein
MMKPVKIRDEKICLNCNAAVESKYCPECGQLNREPNLRFRDVVQDAFRLLTNFDGKFFNTVRLLVTRPGYLSTAFLRGQRAGYLPPVQMYFFTSAVFFFVLYTFIVKPPEKSSLQDDVSLNKNSFIQLNDSANADQNFKSAKEYLAHQDSLPEERRDGVLDRFINLRIIKWKQKFEADAADAFAELINLFMGGFSNAAFLSLPALALILYLIFLRRKDLGYVHHTIFLVHLFVFYFIMTLLNILLKIPTNLEGWGFMHYPAALVLVWILYYGYKAFKNFYQLSVGRASFVYLLFLIFGSITVAVVYFSYFIVRVLIA